MKVTHAQLSTDVILFGFYAVHETTIGCRNPKYDDNFINNRREDQKTCSAIYRNFPNFTEREGLSPFTTLNKKFIMFFFRHLYTEYSYMFRSTKDHQKGASIK